MTRVLKTELMNVSALLEPGASATFPKGPYVGAGEFKDLVACL